MPDISNKKDIIVLVNTFYDVIRKDDLLGPIFNSHITTEQWPAHLKKLSDFWETALFGVISFKGNPTAAHRKVDQNLNHTVSESHFNQWITLWHATIDALYQGEIANKAKQAAIRMAQGQFNAITMYR